MIDEVTLFCFWGSGDVLNYTWAPREIKERISKNIKVRILCRKNHHILFQNNKYVDEIVDVNENLAEQYKRIQTIGLYKNEINMWCLFPPKEIMDSSFWDIPWEVARNLNIFFKCDVFKKEDNFLPEIYYTDEDRKVVADFVQKNSPYIIVETEFKSGQNRYSSNDIMSIFSKNIKNDKFKYFTSCFFTNVIEPFQNLSNFTLPQAGLIIEQSRAFYGMSSGLTVMSFERTLKELNRRIFACHKPFWYDCVTKHNQCDKTIMISSDAYLNFTISDINKLDI